VPPEDEPFIFIVLHCRMSILKKLGHIDADGLVLLKGRAACQVS